MLTTLLAQAADPISGLSGSAGWAGAGLLGLVLCWLLFFHLPAKDKQLKEFTDAKDKQLEEQSDRYDRRSETIAAGYLAEMRDTKAEFKAALNAVLVHCEKDLAELITAFRTELNIWRDKQ